MDETIDALVENIKNSLSGWPWMDRACLLTEIAVRLKAAAYEYLCIEYGLTEE